MEGVHKKPDNVLVGGELTGLLVALKLTDAGKRIILLEEGNQTGRTLSRLRRQPIQKIQDLLSHISSGSKIFTNQQADPIDELVFYIESQGAEIVHETPVERLSLHEKYNMWSLHTPWGVVPSPQVALFMDRHKAYDLTKPIFGREAWFQAFSNTPDILTLLPKTKPYGLFVGDDFRTTSTLDYIKQSLRQADQLAQAMLR